MHRLQPSEEERPLRRSWMRGRDAWEQTTRPRASNRKSMPAAARRPTESTAPASYSWRAKQWRRCIVAKDRGQDSYR